MDKKWTTGLGKKSIKTEKKKKLNKKNKKKR